MSDQGFVKLPRVILSHPSYKTAPAAHKQVLITILEHMSYREQRVMTRCAFEKYDPTPNQEIVIQPGQLLCSHKKLSQWAGVTRLEVQRAITRFTSTVTPKRVGRPRKASTDTGKIVIQPVIQPPHEIMIQPFKPIFECEKKYKKLLLTLTWSGIMFSKESIEKIVESGNCDTTSDHNYDTTSDTTSTPHPFTTKTYTKKTKERNIYKERKVAASDPLIAVREMVLLTQREHEALLKRFGEEDANAMLDILDSHNTKRDEHYKKDYGALKSGGWVYQELQKRKTKAEGTNGKVTQGFIKPGPDAKYRARNEITV